MMIMNKELNQKVIFGKALADDTRQEIMQCLCCVWLSVNDLVDKLDGRVNQPTVSHHLKILADAGLVNIRHDGKYRYYTLNEERFTVCCGMLQMTFAPSFSNNIVPINAIPLADAPKRQIANYRHRQWAGKLLQRRRVTPVT
jgi:ArsR family transcriptional regulator